MVVLCPHFGHLGLRSLFIVTLRPGGLGSPQIGGFCGSTAFEEFSQADWIFPVCAPQKAIYHRYSGFLLCVLLKKPFNPFTLDFSSVLAKTPLKAMLPQKPPI